MRILTIEGIIKNGQIELSENIFLPENTVVYVVIPSLKVDATKVVHSQMDVKEDSEKTVEDL